VAIIDKAWRLMKKGPPKIVHCHCSKCTFKNKPIFVSISVCKQSKRSMNKEEAKVNERVNKDDGKDNGKSGSSNGSST
jgi:hypothetical protein